jgi:polyhydroxybutyrate depolymerase
MVQGSVRTDDGRERTYSLYVPATLLDDHPVPLLVAFHGGGGSGSQFARASGFDAIADEEGFLVVFPDGATGTWNAGGCCGVAEREGVDDVAFVRRLIEEIAADHDVDADRVYVAGHSNGAMLAYRLACELGDVVAAAGAQSGGLEVDRCAPARPVSLIHLHGTADPRVPYGGGVGPDSRVGNDFRSAPESAGIVAAADGCDPDPAEAADPDNGAVRTTTWSCPDAAVELVTVEGAGHGWFGSDRAARLGNESAGVVSSRLIWEFLAAHPRR